MNIKYFNEDKVTSKKLSKKSLKEYYKDKRDLISEVVNVMGRQGTLNNELLFCRYDGRFFIEYSEIHLNSLSIVIKGFDELSEKEYYQRMNTAKKNDLENN